MVDNNDDMSDRGIRVDGGVHAANAGRLLDRPPPDNYVEEWTTLLMQKKEQPSREPMTSVVIFRLGDEWMAMGTIYYREVTEVSAIHSIPHRRKTLLLGVVNIRGRLRLCGDVRGLLEIDKGSCTGDASKGFYNRLVVIDKGGERWAFPADEVYGIYRFSSNALENVPTTVSKSMASFLKGMVAWNGKSVGFIDEEALFEGLRRRAL